MSLQLIASRLAVAGVGHRIVTAARFASFDDWLLSRKPSSNNALVEKLRKQIEDGLAEIKSPKKKLDKLKESMADWKMRLEAHYRKSSEMSAGDVSRYVTALAIARDRYVDVRRQMQGARQEAASKPKPTKSGFDANAEYCYYYRGYRAMSDDHTWIVDVWLTPKEKFDYALAKKLKTLSDKLRESGNGGFGTDVSLGANSRNIKLSSIKAKLAHGYAGLVRPLIRLHKAEDLASYLPKVLKATGDIKAIVSKSAK